MRRYCAIFREVNLSQLPKKTVKICFSLSSSISLARFVTGAMFLLKRGTLPFKTTAVFPKDQRNKNTATPATTK